VRIRILVLIVSMFILLASAQAGTITVTFTSAFAATTICNHVAPLFATCSDSNSVGSGSAVADVLSGHLGAAVGANAPGFVSAFAQATVIMSLQDFTDADVMEIDMSLHGSFNNGGANAFLHVDDGNSITTYGVSCGDGIVFLYNRPCNPADGTDRAFILLANLDTLSLTFELQPGISNVPGFAQFLNSFDSTIKVPVGTTIVNGPGGTLFQPQSTTAPEPSSLVLIGSGLAGLLRFRRRRPA
jgi:PEP-CTERM motif